MTLEKIVKACLPHFENEHLGVPKYARFYNAIKQAVHAGDLLPGDKLPSEQALSARLPASLGTLQKALKALSDDGIVIREHGRGTFIRDQEVKFEDIRVFRFLDEGRPLPLNLQGLGIREVELDTELAEFFGQQRAAVVQRLVQVEGEPWTFNEFYMPLAYAEALMERPASDFDGLSLHEYLFHTQRILTSRFMHRLGVGPFSADARHSLALPDDVQCGMQWQVRGYSRDGLPTTFQRFELQPGHREIEITTQAMQPAQVTRGSGA
ncbi:GntR family transcriptional regulator [Halomonas cupida]|uniref:GntR family transcriptional regulator n=1 Tax=Halomonas cupida TaxID=44933 RepID=A0A1M7CQ30_9GAMM|nr:GntR family transcriptional regulator [Halomonas cupida]GEN26039.1 GntR family transcriptional regulator [Halomonas cupida]SHL68909.1 transcriptional regulator, GntR family [Halomonas cupida]